MSKKDAFLSALKQSPFAVTDPRFVDWRKKQEEERSAADLQYMRNLGIVPGEQFGARLPFIGGPEPYTVGLGSTTRRTLGFVEGDPSQETVLGNEPTMTQQNWKGMGPGERFKEAFTGTPVGMMSAQLLGTGMLQPPSSPEAQKKQQEFFRDLPDYWAKEYQRLMPMGDVPLRDKHGKIYKWVPRDEYENLRSPLDPIERASADPLLVVGEALFPSSAASTAWTMRAMKLGDEALTPKMLNRTLRGFHAPNVLNNYAAEVNEEARLVRRMIQEADNLEDANRWTRVAAELDQLEADLDLAHHFLRSVDEEHIPDLIGDSAEAMRARNKFYNSENMPPGFRQQDITRINNILKDQTYVRKLRSEVAERTREIKSKHDPMPSEKSPVPEWHQRGSEGPERQYLKIHADELRDRFEPGSPIRQEYQEAAGSRGEAGRHTYVTTDLEDIKELSSLDRGPTPPPETRPAGQVSRRDWFHANPTVEESMFINPFYAPRYPGQGNLERPMENIQRTVAHEVGHLGERTDPGTATLHDIKRIAGDLDVPTTRLEYATGDGVTEFDKPRQFAITPQTKQAKQMVIHDEAHTPYYQRHYRFYPEGQGPQSELRWTFGGEDIDELEAARLARGGRRPITEPPKTPLEIRQREVPAWYDEPVRGYQFGEVAANYRADLMTNELGDAMIQEMQSGQPGMATRMWYYYNKKNPTKRGYQGPWTRDRVDQWMERIEKTEANKPFTIDDVVELEGRMEELWPTSHVRVDAPDYLQKGEPRWDKPGWNNPTMAKRMAKRDAPMRAPINPRESLSTMKELAASRGAKLEHYTDSHGNLNIRVTLPDGRRTLVSDEDHLLELLSRYE